MDSGNARSLEVLEIVFQTMSLPKIFANPGRKPDVCYPSRLRIEPVNIQLFQHSSTSSMVRMPMGVDLVANLVNSFTFKALVNIFRRIEQNACSSEEDRRPISDEPSSIMPSFLTDRA